MSPASYIIRDYQASDLDRLLEREGTAGARDQTGCMISPSDLIESVSRGDYGFVNVIVAERAGEIIGYASVTPEVQLGRAVLRWRVHSDRRTWGIAGKLVDNAISHTLSLGIKTVHVNIWQNSPTAKKLLRIRGFRCIRRYLELRLDLSKTPLTAMEKSRIRYRFLKPGEEEGLTHLQNRSFAGAWGYNPNTLDEMILRTRLPGFSRRDIIIAFESDKKPIGYCWTKTYLSEDKGPNQRMGRIHMLGVDPDYRGRGIGRRLLVAGISALARKDLRIIELTVDQENEAACALYRSVGFRVWKSSLWYEMRFTNHQERFGIPQ
ncbi:MAG: GNAT family N-acetyltransferase [Syntrophorhabdales bacterium]|jgi:mycothiol synthase